MAKDTMAGTDVERGLRAAVSANLEAALALVEVVSSELERRQKMLGDNPEYTELALAAHITFKMADIAGYLSKHATKDGREVALPR